VAVASAAADAVCLQLADGNTWNHEHIATLGRILSAPEKDAHRIARHVADYVLVWAGGANLCSSFIFVLFLHHNECISC